MSATTVNLHHMTLSKITAYAKRKRSSRRAIIVELLMKTMRDHDRNKFEMKSIRYQTTRSKQSWHCFHIEFKDDEYEFFIDLRKVTKCSVSLLIAMAVERYLKNTPSRSFVPTDKYPLFGHYLMVTEIVDGIISWRFFWGLPIGYIQVLGEDTPTEQNE